jgi:hypothetical protein
MDRERIIAAASLGRDFCFNSSCPPDKVAEVLEGKVQEVHRDPQHPPLTIAVCPQHEDPEQSLVLVYQNGHNIIGDLEAILDGIKKHEQTA